MRGSSRRRCASENSLITHTFTPGYCLCLINPLRGIRVPAAEHTPPYESFLESRGFRPEIQGLRAFAVLLVVLYHVWIGKVSGGVDVFLFISAFLLSLSFMRKINEGKALNLLAYWTHVFARLLPAAAVVIVLTLAASLTILPALYWNARAVDAQASLFYYQNWNLANGAVNYFAQGISDKSPFQHFWSLSFQGQIFLLWPILFAVAAFLVHRVRFKPVPAAVTVFGTVFMTSFALQMTAAFEPIAQRTGTNQMNLLETGCPYPFAAPEGYLNDRKKRCIAFSQKATEEILRLKPTTVVIIATTTDKSADAETADPNLDETLRVFTDAGIQVIGLRDNPRFTQDMYVCAIRAQGDKSSCSEPIEQKYGDNPAAPIFEKYADRGAYLLDLKDIYCPDGLCRSVIGNVYVYADTNHLTKAFEHTLAETIYERALAAGWKPEGYPGS